MMDGTAMTAKASARPAIVSPQTPIRSESRPTAATSRRGACFTCNKEGHWFRDCPNKGKKTSEASDSGRPSLVCADPPDMMCACERGPCIVRCRQDNPDSKFYGCPMYFREKPPRKCSFTRSCPKPDDVRVVFHREPPHMKCPCGVGWCLRREVDSGDFARWNYLACPGRERRCHFLFYYRVVTPESAAGPADDSPLCYPLCSCGAGRCRLWMERTNGRHLGRLYFTCPVLKGQGACNLILWIDHLQGKEEMKQNLLSPEEIEELDDCEQLPNAIQSPKEEIALASPIDLMTLEEYDAYILEAKLSLKKRDGAEFHLSSFAEESLDLQTEVASNVSEAPAVTETTEGLTSEELMMVDEITSNAVMYRGPQRTVHYVANQVANCQAKTIFPRHQISFRQRVTETWAQWLIGDGSL